MEETQTDPFVDEPEEGSENATISAVRGWGREQEKGRKAAEKAAEEAKKRADVLSLKVAKATFKEAGLSENLAGLFFKATPDFDPETLSKDEVLAFAKENGIPVGDTTEQANSEEEETEGTNSETETSTEQTTEAEETETPTNQPKGVKPLGGSKPLPQKITTKEIWELAKKNDPRVKELVAKEARTPGYIEYSHPEDIKDIE